jgi:hypothetical protein
MSLIFGIPSRVIARSACRHTSGLMLFHLAVSLSTGAVWVECRGAGILSKTEAPSVYPGSPSSEGLCPETSRWRSLSWRLQMLGSSRLSGRGAFRDLVWSLESLVSDIASGGERWKQGSRGKRGVIDRLENYGSLYNDESRGRGLTYVTANRSGHLGHKGCARQEFHSTRG